MSHESRRCSESRRSIDFLGRARFGVTILDRRAAELQNKFRVFQNGAGSYDWSRRRSRR
jgi:hypothetical protein